MSTDPLPTCPADPTHPVLRRDLLAAGWTEGEVADRLRSGTLLRVRPGAYCSPEPVDARGRHRRAVLAALAAVADDAVVCDISVAALHGLPLWRVALDRVHVSRQRRTGGRLGRLVDVHPAPLEGDEVTEVVGQRVTSVARTVVDVARRLPWEQAVVVADGALHTGRVTVDELAGALARAAHRRGAPAARRSIAFADARSESVGESRSRVAVHRAGLPAPVPQWAVRGPGGFVARADLGWPERRTVGEFDGRVEHGRLLRPGQSAGDAVVAEKIREDRLRDEDLRVVRWTWDELAHFDVVAARLHRAFSRA